VLEETKSLREKKKQRDLRKYAIRVCWLQARKGKREEVGGAERATHEKGTQKARNELVVHGKKVANS